MSDAAILGLPAEFTFENVSYKVGPRTFEVEAAFRRWLEREALHGLQRHKDDYAPDEYAMQLAGLRADCATGLYAFPSLAFMAGLASLEGAKEMAFLRLKKQNPQASRELVERLFADDSKWAEFVELCRGLDYPNSPKPATGPAANEPPLATPPTS